jgi:uncharacterized paraquat-inducible protein A
MHWFWRAVISIAAGVSADLGLFATLSCLAHYTNIHPFPSRYVMMVFFGSMIIFPQVVAIAVFHLIPPLDGSSDGETHCRKCHYILRGISEPRCPECGERI